MSTPHNFVVVPIVVRPHQVAHIYAFAAKLAQDEDLAFPFTGAPPDSHAGTQAQQLASQMKDGTAKFVSATPVQVAQTAAAPPAAAVAEAKPATAGEAKPDPELAEGPPRAVPATVDATKFSGCTSMTQVVAIIIKDLGLKTFDDVKAVVMKLRAEGSCRAASAVPEDALEGRIKRGLDMASAP